MTIPVLLTRPAAPSACQPWCRTRHDCVIVTPDADYHHLSFGEVPASGMPHTSVDETHVSVEAQQHAHDDPEPFVTVFGPGAVHEDDPLRFTAAEARQIAALILAAANTIDPAGVTA